MLSNHFNGHDPPHVIVFSRRTLHIQAKALAPLRDVRTDACHVMWRGRVDLVFQYPKTAIKRFGKLMRMRKVIHGANFIRMAHTIADDRDIYTSCKR